MKMSKSVEDYIAKSNFKTGLTKLRAAVLATGLDETVKWGMPVYTHEGKNILGIGSFKAHFGIWFFQGALLQDKHKKLSNAQEDKTKAMRQWRMSTIKDVDVRVIKAYVREAVDLQKSGIRVAPRKPPKRAPAVPPELQATFDAVPKVRAAFGKLSPAKQTEYVQYISEAKRAATRASRIAKIKPLILEGKGLMDQYKSGR